MRRSTSNPINVLVLAESNAIFREWVQRTDALVQPVPPGENRTYRYVTKTEDVAGYDERKTVVVRLGRWYMNHQMTNGCSSWIDSLVNRGAKEFKLQAWENLPIQILP